MRRNPGVGSSPAAVAHVLRRNLVGDPFVVAPYQWGVVHAVHGSYSSTLYAAASAGSQTVELQAAPSVNDLLLVGTNPPLRVTAVTGSAAPYTATVYPAVATAEASGTAVTAAHTCDVYFDGTQNSGSAYLTVAVRYLASYTPAVGDVVVAARGASGLATDRLILGKPA